MLISENSRTTLTSTTQTRGTTYLNLLINNIPGAYMDLVIRKNQHVYIRAKGLEYRVEALWVDSITELWDVTDSGPYSAPIAAVATYILNKAAYGTVPLPELLPIQVSERIITFLVNRTFNKILEIPLNPRGDITSIGKFGLLLPQPINCKGKTPSEVAEWFLQTKTPQIEFFKWRATFDPHFLWPIPFFSHDDDD